MDDQGRQPAQDSAEEARAKGADLEYDTEDENALNESPSSPAPEDTTRSEGN